MRPSDLVRTCIILLIGSAALAGSNARATSELPPVEEVLRQLVQRARSPRNPASLPYYLCTKQTVTEEFDKAGRMTSKNVKLRERRSNFSGASDANKWSSSNGIQLNQELLQRYQFNILRRDTFAGRPAFVLSFAVKNPPPPINQLQDRFLNRAIGTVWIDAADYELVKANISLAEPVNFFVLGAVDALTFSFERSRTADGSWLTSYTDTSFRGRKLLKPLQFRRRVDYTNFRKLNNDPEPQAHD